MGEKSYQETEMGLSKYSHLAGKHLYMRDPAYERILKESKLSGTEGGCWFGALATLVGAINLTEPGEELERVFGIFQKYDPNYLTGANKLLAGEDRIKDLKSMPRPFADESGGVSFAWFRPKHIDNTLKLINAMFSHEKTGVKMGYVDLSQIVLDELNQESLTNEFRKVSFPSEGIYREIINRSIGIKLVELFEGYAKDRTGIMLDVKKAYRDGKDVYHIVAVQGVVRVPNLGAAILINDPSQKESSFLPESMIGDFFTAHQGIQFMEGDKEGTVYIDYITPTLTVSIDTSQRTEQV